MSAIAPTQPTIPASDPGWIPSRLYRMTVDEYEAMVESGGLKARNAFHLINGYLVAKMTQNPPHRVADELCAPSSTGSSPPIGTMSRGPSRSGSPAGTANPSPIAASSGGGSATTRITIPGRTKSP